jgi:hypothetical protein
MITQEHPSKLRDNEFVLLENIDIVAAGVATNRAGYKKVSDPSPMIVAGVSQGVFIYDTLGANMILHAQGGRLYKVVGNVYTEIAIINLPSGFQTTRPIEAVQLRASMYFATGSGLVKFDGGTTATLVSAYQPTGLEALYVGTNGLAADPDNYIQDNTAGAANLVLGIKSDQRYGVINKNVTFTAYVEKIASDTLQYQWSSKLVSEAKYTVYQAWGSSKTRTHKFTKNADYQIKCEIRKVSTTVVLSEFILPKFRVSSVPDVKPEATINFEDMKLCNRILLHYDRLILYGDTNNPDHMYTSHLNNFSYFPRTNIIRVTDPLRGSLRSVVQYRNFIVCFTDNSIQMITGVEPKEYVKQTIHTTIGTIYPYSVQIIKNYVIFVSQEGGAYILKSFNYSTTDKLNVERVDSSIRDSLKQSMVSATKILSGVYNEQYYISLTVGSTTTLYRYYFEYNIWVKDTVAVPFSTMKCGNNVMYLSTDTTGRLYSPTNNFYFDDVTTVFNMVVGTKNYDFNMSHHKKKLKQFQLMLKLTSTTVVTASLYTDNVLVNSTPTTASGVVGKDSMDSQKFIFAASGSFRYIKAVISIPVKGTTQLLDFGFIFKQSSPK